MTETDHIGPRPVHDRSGGSGQQALAAGEAIQGRAALTQYEYLRAWHLFGTPPCPQSLLAEPEDAPNVLAARSYLTDAIEHNDRLQQAIGGAAQQFHRDFGRLADATLPRRGLTAEQRAVRVVAEQAAAIHGVLASAQLVPDLPEPDPEHVSPSFSADDEEAMLRVLRWEVRDGEEVLALLRGCPYVGHPSWPPSGVVVLTDERVLAYRNNDLQDGKPPLWEQPLTPVTTLTQMSRSGSGGWVELPRNADGQRNGIEFQGAHKGHEDHLFVFHLILSAARRSSSSQAELEM